MADKVLWASTSLWLQGVPLDWLTFISTLIQALVWPVIVLVLVLLLRQPLRDLIPLLRKLKYKDVEMEFAREIAELKLESLDEALRFSVPAPAAESPSVTPGADDAGLAVGMRGSRRDELLRMVSFSKRVAIMEAWLELEAAAVELASSFWLQSPGDAFRNDPKLAEYLLKCKVIDEKQYDTFKKLRDLRNMAAHATELNLSENDAASYVELAFDLATHLRRQ